MRTIKVSVRRLVEFLLRSGDIDAGSAAADLDAMQLGSDVHRRLQAMQEEPYQAEVPLSRSFYFPQGQLVPAALCMDVDPATVGDDPTGWFLKVEGRADGVIDVPSGVTVDEIKGTYADVAALEGPLPVHLAQAKVYAYLYLRKVQAEAHDATLRRADPVTVRLTYVGLSTGEVQRMSQALWFQDLEGWFLSLLADYHRWLGPREDHVRWRGEALRSLAFPFPWRPGQEELARQVGKVVGGGGRLYLQAPTGSGKTVACVWPALRRMGEGRGRRLVYLTAKTIARQAAVGCLDLLNGHGARLVAVVLTARERVCPLRQDVRAGGMRSAGRTTPCNPVECPYARGHYDRVGQVAHEMLVAAETGAVLGRQEVLAAADRHRVCPYDLQLELADWADVVVCDYNYVFSPATSLRCLGEDPKEAVLLVDEAHNLVDRARDLYSAELAGAPFARAAKAVGQEGGQEAARLAEALGRVAALLGAGGPAGRKRLEAGRGDRPAAGNQAAAYRVVGDFGGLPGVLEGLLPLMERYLSGVPAADQVRDPFVITSGLHLQVLGFLSALERAKEADGGYVLYQEDLGGAGRRARVFCADPSADVGERLAAVRASVLFSATLVPEDYYRQLLAARPEDPSWRATSSFDPSRQLVLVGRDVTMRYSRRDRSQYRRVATYVSRLVEARAGNYLVFLPSYAVLEAVRAELADLLPASARVLAQRGRMGEREREDFLAAFRTGHGGEQAGLPGRAEGAGPRGQALAQWGPSLVGLCVLGGFFAESVDLRGEALVGVVVAGVGLPGLSADREVVRRRFEEAGRDGFAYAYTYPGWARVLQAVGRLIRTEDDAGVVALLDDRFATPSYQSLFPDEWSTPQVVTEGGVAGQLDDFWRRVDLPEASEPSGR